jgi:hypothetical protein
MAWSHLGNIGTATLPKTSGTSLVLTPTATLNAGNVGILVIACDNTQTTDGSTNEVSQVTATPTGNWTKLREYCNGGGGAANGTVVAVYYTKAAADVTTSDDITITFANAVVAKAATLHEFSIGAGSTVEVAGTPQDLADDAVDNPGSQTISGLTSAEYLFVRACGYEGTVASGSPITVTANYTLITAAATTGGAGGSNQVACGEFRILTGTGDTSDPTGNGATAREWSSVYLALHEVSAAPDTGEWRCRLPSERSRSTEMVGY